MASTFRIRAKLLARVVVPILFAAALSACSSVPDWVDPTTWVGGGNQASSDQTSDAGAATDESTTAGQEAASAQPTPADQTPDIAAIPPKPAPPSTADQQKQVADSLAADRAQAHYSADALRGGTEATAAPPPAESAPPPASANSGSPPTPDASASSADETADAGAPPAADNQAASNPPAPPADAKTSSMATSEAQAEPAARAGNPASGSAPSEVASADSPGIAAPATAPIAATTGVPSAQGTPDMQATFAPSKAPALDPSVSQFVPQQILSRYHETAAAAAVPASETSTTARAKHHKKKIKTSQRAIRLHYVTREGFRRLAMMPGSFSAPRHDVSVHDVSPHRSASTATSGGLDPAIFAPTSGSALEVVGFTRETAGLDRIARNRIQTAARNFTAQGGNGFVRVVGHASEQAKNLPRAIRLRNNFEKSEAQAAAVARELIRDGVPAQKVVVEAVGERRSSAHDLAPLNRTAEIYLQS